MTWQEKGCWTGQHAEPGNIRQSKTRAGGIKETSNTGQVKTGKIRAGGRGQAETDKLRQLVERGDKVKQIW